MWGNLKEGDHLEEQSADGTMLKLVLKKTGWKGIGLAHDREQRRILVNYIMRSMGGSTSRISRLTVETASFSRRTLIHAIGAHSRVSSKYKGKGHPRTGHECPEEE